VNLLKIGMLVSVCGYSRRDCFKVILFDQYENVQVELQHPNGLRFWVKAGDCWPWYEREFRTLKEIGAHSISEAKRILSDQFLAQFEHREALESSQLSACGIYMSKVLAKAGNAWFDSNCNYWVYFSDAWAREVGR
jgi:hypothetical protein